MPEPQAREEHGIHDSPTRESVPVTKPSENIASTPSTRSEVKTPGHKSVDSTTAQQAIPEVVWASNAAQNQYSQSSELVSWSEFTAGPLPPASELAAYAKIDPQIVETVLRMAEREQAHTHEITRKEQERRVEHDKGVRVERRIGQFLAFGVALAGLGVSLGLGINGYPWSATTVGSGTLAVLVGAFIGGRVIEARRSPGERKVAHDRQA